MSAPDVSMPQNTPDQSALASAVVGNTPPQMPSPQSPGSPMEQQTDADLSGPQNGGGGSRLLQILSAVAKVGATGLSGIPNRGRPNFVSGLGEGARAEQTSEATQQAIRFKTFDDSVRAAQLHNQDLELQAHTQAQQDAHQAAQDAQHDWDESHGVQYEEIPNSGQAATDYLTAQTTANGGASIPAGTHLSADGKSILIPKQSDATQAGQLQKYNTFREAFNLPALPQGAQFVPSKNLDMLQNRIEGHSLNGDVYNHDTLPTAIADLQSTRDSLASKGDSNNAPALKQVDATIKSMQAKLDFLDNHKATVLQQAEDAKVSAQTSPEAIAGAAKKAGAVANAELPAKQALQDNAAGNKTQSVGSVVGFDPQTNERVVVNANDPKAPTLTQSGKVSSSQLDNWGTAQNQFANVQLAVSRYDQAARTFAQSGKPSDAVGINSALNKSGIGDVQIGEWGVRVPGFSSVAEAASRVANSAAFKALSPAGQDLVDKYFRMMSSIPEYQKASTGIGRTNKEMLDLELKNIPDPTMPPTIISNRLSSFQEALNSNASRVPRIQGIPSAKEVQQHYSQQTQPATPSGGSNLSRAVTNPIDFVNSLQPR